MASFPSLKTRPAVMTAALAGTAMLTAPAVGNYFAARRAERRHPPEGAFMEVDGVRLHYRDRGTGSPVVLIHGDAER